jgi:uncharacterized membrane protein
MEGEVMAELTVVGFQGIHRAAEVLNEVQELNTGWRLDLKDAVAVYRTQDGKLRVDQSVQPTRKEGAGWGGLLGGMLGALLVAPFTAGLSAAAAATAVGMGAVTLGATGALIAGEDAADWKATYGISEEFVQQVGGVLQPGQSAVFVLALTSDPEAIAERFRGYGGKVLRTTVALEQAKKFQEMLRSENGVLV